MLIITQDEQTKAFKLSVSLISCLLFSVGATFTFNACQLTEKNISYDACLAGKAPCPEICNGEDDDEDGLIDESLTETCIVLSSLKLERGDQESGFGRAIVAVPDINDDGMDDLLVSSSRGPSEINLDSPEEGEVSLIDGASLQIIRTVKYGGDFGQAIAVGKFGTDETIWCASAPSKEGNNNTYGRVLCLNFEGDVLSSIRSESAAGFGQWLSTRNQVDQDQLIISDPYWQKEGDNDEGAVGARGRVLLASFRDSDLEINQSLEGSEPGQKIAEKIIGIGDSNEDGIDDFLMTGYPGGDDENRQVWVVSGAEENGLNRLKRFSIPENTAGLFGESLAVGRFDSTLDSELLAFGAPYIEGRDDSPSLGRVYFTSLFGDPLGTSSARLQNEDEAGLGISMVTVKLGEQDFLVSAGAGLIRVINVQDGKAVVVDEFTSLPSGIKPVLSASQNIDKDGSLKVWIALPEIASVRYLSIRPASATE